MNVDSSALTVLSLCAGGGGLDLGLELAVGSARVVCFVEWDVFAVSQLVTQMEAGTVAPAPVWTDLRTFDGRPWRGRVHCVTAGYPCQPFSQAGKRGGEDDARHLWPEVYRVVQEVRPALVFLENVAGHVGLGLGGVLRNLRDAGYRATATLVRASDVGAPHQRERVFILGVDESSGARLEGWGDVAAESSARGTVRWKPVLGDASNAVANPRRSGDERRRHDVSGTAGGAQGAGHQRERDGDAAGTEGDAVADTERYGQQQPHDSKPERRSDQASADIGRAVPLFPPGPSDLDAWQRILEHDPSLSPALEPEVRSVANELASQEVLTDDEKRTVQACEAADFDIWRAVCRMRLAILTGASPSRPCEGIGSGDSLRSLSRAAQCCDKVGWKIQAAELRNLQDGVHLQQAAAESLLPIMRPPQGVDLASEKPMTADRRQWLRLLGNGVVPLQAAYAFTALSIGLGLMEARP